MPCSELGLLACGAKMKPSAPKTTPPTHIRKNYVKQTQMIKEAWDELAWELAWPRT